MIDSIIEEDDEPSQNSQNEGQIRPEKDEKEALIESRFLEICNEFLSNSREEQKVNNKMKKLFNSLRASVEEAEGEKSTVDIFFKQDRNIVFNPHLVIFLIKNKVICLKEWQKQFAFNFNRPPLGMNEFQDIYLFLELVVILGVIDKKLFTKEDIPDLYEYISSFAAKKNGSHIKEWKCLLKLFTLDEYSHQDDYEEICRIYFEQL